MTIAVYAGTFDPITNGHLDVAMRAARLFDKVYIGVYDSPAATRPTSSGSGSAGRGLLFTTEERVAMAKAATKGIANVEVVPFRGLVVDFAASLGARTLVRGLRMVADFENEFETAMMNKKLHPDLDLVCLFTSINYQFVSSSLLKEVAGLGGNIDDMVPNHVAKMLREKLAGRKAAA